MINTSCGHIMMCEDCFRAYRKKCGSDICECPICKAKGQYIKFVQPKYAWIDWKTIVGSDFLYLLKILKMMYPLHQQDG